MAISKINPNSLGGMPAFSAYPSGSQTPTNGVNTKVQYNTEEFDTNSNYDNATNYRFTPTVAGYYQIVVSVMFSSITYNTYMAAQVFKNGSLFKSNQTLSAGTSGSATQQLICTALVYLNGSTDYVEGYTYQNGTATTNANSVYTYFQGSLVRAA